MPLHREDVIRTAVELLDEVGLDRLTTRALTTRLGVRPGALYWHVHSKQELLTAIADKIMSEAFAEPTAEPTADEDAAVAGGVTGGADEDPDWVTRTTAFAHRTRNAMLAHRDGARVVAGHLSMGTGTLEAAEQGLALMRAAGVPLTLAAYFGDTITSYVTGFVLQEQATAPAPSGPLPEIEPTRFPHLAQWQATKPATRDDAFATGLSLIIRGLQADLGELTRRQQRTRTPVPAQPA